MLPQCLSVRNKAIPNYVVSQSIDVLALTETWLRTDTDQLIINVLVPGGYKFNHIPRKSGRGDDSIGILYKSGLAVTLSKSTDNEDVYSF